MNNSARLAGSFAVLLFSFVLQGCSKDNTGGGVGHDLQSVEVTPASPHVEKGGSQQFTAVAHYTDGSFNDVSSQATWSSSATSVATVGNTGIAQAIAVGTTTIGASFGGLSGSTSLTVDPAGLDHIEINPLSPSIAKGTTQQFAATAIRTDGTSDDVSSTVVWNSSNATVATIDGNGLAHGLAVGTTTISANLAGKAGGNSASTTLTVSAALLTGVSVAPSQATIAKGTDQSFVAIGTFSDNSTQDITEVASWNSSNPATATVSNTAGTRGKTHGVAPGTSTISATAQGMLGSAVVTVTDAVVTAVNLTPPNPSIVKATSQQFTATATFSDSTTQDVTTSSNWTTSDTTVATITQQGKATGLKAGTSTIGASYQGHSGSTTLTVTPATLSSIAVTPTTPSLAKGSDQQFTATATFSDSTTQDVTTLATWSSSNASAVTISNADGSQGKAHAVAPGTSTIGAAYQGKSASTTMTVTNAVVSRIEISPPNPTVPKGNNQQFSAQAVYTDDSTQNVTNSVTWSSSNTGVADISNATGSKGLAAATGIGSATISAVSGGITGTTTMTVTSASITSIEVAPINPSQANGFNLQFTARAVFSDNTNGDVTNQVTWSSTNTSVATISNAAGSKGLATANKTGAANTATIVAQQGSVQGSTTFTVNDLTLSKLEVAPASAAIPLGASQQFTATGTFSDSSTQDLTTQVTWSSSDPTVATISNAAGSKGLAKSVKSSTSAVTITAKAPDGTTATAQLTVNDKAIVSIQVTPATSLKPTGQLQKFTATATYTDNTTADITTSATWSSSSDSIATVSNAAGHNGEATGASAGTATITATQGGKSGSGKITVTSGTLQSITLAPQDAFFAKGLKVQYTATGNYSDGTSVNITPYVTWQSSNTGVAAASNDPKTAGLVTMIDTGVSNISATLGSVTKSTPVHVTATALQSISISPVNPSVPNGTTQPLTATAHYGDGSTFDFTTRVTWSTDNAPVADVSNASGSQGVVIARAQGVANITATDPASTKSATTKVTVGPGTLQGILVTPSNGKVPSGFTRQFTAIGQYSDSSQQDITLSASWSTVNPAIATVGNGGASGAKGLVTGVAVGSTTLQANQGGFTGNTTVTVTSTTLTSVKISPNPAADIHGNASEQFTAEGTFSDATKLDVTEQMQWASSNTNAVTVSNSAGTKGRATGATLPGSSQISATRNSVTDAVTVNHVIP